MHRKFWVGAAIAAGVVVLNTAPAVAQDGGVSPESVVLDNLWVLVAAVLVFIMQAGFGMVEAGMTRAKNVGNIMAKNLADMCVGALAFFAVGYGIAYGTDAGSLLGTDTFFLSGAELGFSAEGGLSMYTDFFFQVVFAATAVTIASGAMAERTKMSAYLVFSFFMTAVIYPVVVHSFWSGEGLLADLAIGDAKFGDFAGSTIVHSTGGWAAMMGAIFLGPRIGKYDRNGRPRTMPGHSVAFVVVGVLVLWFGWFGFNAGSELAADDVVMRAAVTTMLAAAAGGVTAAAVVWLRSGHLDVAMTGNGVLAGLVGITAGTATMTPVGAVLAGAVAGVIVVASVAFFDRVRIDDPVGAISVHGVCGLWGTLAVGLFARYGDGFVATDNAGLFYGGGFDQLLVQFIGAALVFVWVAATTGILFAVIKHTVGLRVPPEVEVSGLDIFEHGQPGYVFRATENGSESAEAVVGATSNGSHNGAGHLNAEAGALED
ncbi:MAG: ammonium transporter [Acidimicrobiaceae bacterium]|nr:ammonium transporter [Acidimicrobiaceae bacterium]MDE0517586.1 ammonium transporter [Acidimicrobiaceae bacterium]MDE0655534.1 ammonium transporter [Acidimicrobiaceae bacterium]MXZ96654.1 ammonium transporter [Acidimicrobiaceae bacterium]MYF42696.1 ammonium transporter [Acidimicrobiaceae bacterium]